MSTSLLHEVERVNDRSTTSAPLLEAAYQRACQRAYRLALALCGDPGVSEDLVHDVFVRLLGRRDLRRDTLDAYVTRAVRNAACDHLRRRAARPRVQRDAEEVAVAPAEGAVDPAAVAAALDTLPPEQREVIQLRVYEQLPFRDVARHLGLPLGTVHSRYRYALAKLRPLLREELS